jgi:geranyl-CoA carboxylase alpha subunit
LEMNTRLQVEHPVTELITGLDLVEWQLRVANGEKLPLTQDELTLTGHAVEVRLYAEDPGVDFLPQTGEILLWQPPSLPGVRVDHGMTSLGEVSPHYDPMIAKIIAYGKTRTDAVRLLARALQDTVLLGVNSNKQFLVNILQNPVLVSGDTNTAFINEHFADDVSLKPAVASHEALAVAASLRVYKSDRSGWQTGIALPIPLKLQVGDVVHKLAIEQKGQHFTLQHDDQTECLEVLSCTENQLVYIWQGIRKSVAFVQAGETQYLDMANGNLTLVDVTHAPPASAEEAGDGQIRAPMNGAVVNILVAEGEKVVKDQTLVILEAMKIQQQIKSNCEGVVGAISATIGLQVKKRQVLMVVSGD